MTVLNRGFAKVFFPSTLPKHDLLSFSLGAELGTWQQVVAINPDNHPRKRGIEVTILGWGPAKLKLKR